MKTAIVVSGGDAPGINAAIDAYARLTRQQGDQALGAQDGFVGLLSGQLAELDRAALALLAGRGGSLLRSSREPALAAEGARERLRSIMSAQGIDNLLLFGGDGTIRAVLPLLAAWGISAIALPSSIDSDVAGTDYTLGHDSACNFALHAIEGIRATAHALPGRVFLMETLGAPSGHLALAVAYAAGAHAAMLPEYEIDMAWLCARLRSCVAQEGYALAVASEAVADIDRLAAEIPRRTGIRLRYTRLGHAQRGADASHFDRCAARDMSRLARSAFAAGIRVGVIVRRDGAFALHEGPLPDAAKAPPDFDRYCRINEL